MNSGSASSRWLACGAIAAASGGVVLALADVDTPLRGPLILLSLAAAPAVVVAAWLKSLDMFARIVVACAAAIALNALVAETMLALGTWSPRACLVAVLLVCAAGSVLRSRPVRDALISHRRAPRSAQGALQHSQES
jgi:hypothetical protein